MDWERKIGGTKHSDKVMKYKKKLLWLIQFDAVQTGTAEPSTSNQYHSI